MFYNTALKSNSGVDRFSECEPTERFEHQGCIGMRQNIIEDGMHEDFRGCDVFYCEPPFPHGIKVYDERAGESTDGFDSFAKSFAIAWESLTVPRMAVVSKRQLRSLSKPDHWTKVKVMSNWENLACWGIKPAEGLTSLQMGKYLGHSHKRIGDLMCGYGMPVVSFMQAKAGNTFVAADYDAQCITALRALMDQKPPIRPL